MKARSNSLQRSNPVFKLGKKTFTVAHNDPFFQGILEQLFAPPCQQEIEFEQSYDVRFGWSPNVDEFFTKLIESHEDCIQIRANSLISPAGKKVLLSGAAESGKTALAMTLVYKHGWRILSEHAVLLDWHQNKVVGFASPFRLRGRVRELLTAIDVSPPHFFLHNYLPVEQNRYAHDCSGSFDFAFHLEIERGKEFACSTIPYFQYLRKILTTSNMSNVVGGVDKFLGFLNGTKCWQITNGSLSERLEKLLELCEATVSDNPSETNSQQPSKRAPRKKTQTLVKK